MTYKDSLSYVDHLNSPEHLRRTNQTYKQDRATVEEVKRRMDYLRSKKAEANRAKDYDLEKRLTERKRVLEEENRLRKERKRAKRGKQRSQDTRLEANGEDEGGAADDEMARIMGFDGFGTTKK